MTIVRKCIAASLVVAICWAGNALAQAGNLLPKYGPGPRNEAEIAADTKFLSEIDAIYKGDRKKAAEDIAMIGWRFYRKGNHDDAMRRFNQAWLLDRENGTALWGMAAIESHRRPAIDSLKLFVEAERFKSGDIDFAVDYARAIGIAAAESRNEALLFDALDRFAKNHKKAPQHTMNLQNWAVTLYYIGRYKEAWEKIKLAEATPRAAEIDPRFIADLRQRMPRP